VVTSELKPWWYFTSPAGKFFGRGVVELGEQVAGHLAQGVDQHVQAAAVGHADHDFLHALLRQPLDQLVHRGDEALAAFKREALLAHILGVQVALQALGCGQAVEDVLFLLGVEGGLAAHATRVFAATNAFAPCRWCTCTRRPGCRSRSRAAHS
jgi:hypothetical protein